MDLRFKSFGKNDVGTDYAVGDIHGCFSRLQARLDALRFDPAQDRLFSVGDLVDRGPESHLAESWVTQPWFHAVMGNHDDMARRWPNGHMDSENYRTNGGGWNIQRPEAEQRHTAEVFKRLPLALEIETDAGLVGVVHADCPRAAWRQFRSALQSRTLAKGAFGALAGVAMWSRSRITNQETAGIPDLRALIVGHTPVPALTILGNVHYIDTGATFGHEFTILELDTLQPV